MIKIAPSVLAADLANLGAEVEQIRLGGADFVHFDVMDGCFVPNISMGVPVLRSLRKATDLFLDVHLMIDRPLRYVDAFCKAGADLVNFHVEADTEENLLLAIEKARALGRKTGVTLKPATPAEAVLPYLPLVDLVLVMTVEPGFGGQSFMFDQLPKVTRVRERRWTAAWTPRPRLCASGPAPAYWWPAAPYSERQTGPPPSGPFDRRPDFGGILCHSSPPLWRT